MKADQINRFMRVNGRKNLWLLRNTNQLYENAVKGHYGRSTSLLPYNPASQNAKVREENRAPVRELSMRQESSPTSDYPRNHVQMAEQAANANSGHLLDTVIKANRRRSMSFTAGGLRMYGSFGRGGGSSSDDISCVIGGSRPKGRQRLAQSSDGDNFELNVLNGRSMSSPPRTTLELGLGYGLGKGKGPPSCAHHLIAIEKSANASAASLARRKRANYECDDDKLMVVDEALKQRLAMRFDRHFEDEPGAARRFRLGLGSDCFIDGRQLPKAPKSRTMRSKQATPHSIGRERTRFQTLGERIKQFKVIQFADGPVAFNAFNRRQGYAGAGIQPQCGNRHLPKQEPCLSFRNVLHTNHRQRSLNFQTRSQSLETNVKPASKPKEPQVPLRDVNSEHNAISEKPPNPVKPQGHNWLSEQQPQHKLDALARLSPAAPLPLSHLFGLKVGPAQPPEKGGKSKSRRSDRQNSSSSRNLMLASSKTKTRARKEKEKEREKKNGGKAKVKAKAIAEVPRREDTTVHLKLQSKPRQDSYHSEPMQTTASNTLSRTNRLLYMKDNARRQDMPAPKPAEQPQAVNKANVRRKHDVLPEQPQLIKGANHLLAASATQVSAFKRAFKNRQQILQAEMLHVHAQRLPEQQQQRQRLQEQQHQQLQRLVQRQQLGKAPNYFPPKHTMWQPKDESKTLAKNSVRMQTTTTTTPPVQHQHQQQSSDKQVAAKGKTRQQPEANTANPPNRPRANNQKLAGIAAAVEATQHLSRKPVPRMAHTYEPAGHVPATEQTTSASYQTRQQQQLHQQLRHRREQPNDSRWRHT